MMLQYPSIFRNEMGELSALRWHGLFIGAIYIKWIELNWISIIVLLVHLFYITCLCKHSSPVAGCKPRGLIQNKKIGLGKVFGQYMV